MVRDIRCVMAILVSMLVLTFFCTVEAKAEQQKTLLIINTYSDSEPWANEVTQPAVLHMATIPDVRCEMQNLNAAIIADSAEYNSLADNIISRYKNQPPQYVMMVGSLAFDMRKRIKEAWGDLPMLLIATDKDFFTPDMFFDTDHDDTSFEMESRHMLIRERKDYNFTAIIIPVFYKETVDMMVGLMPKMEELVYMADSIYFNRKTAYGIQSYINEQYPGLKFSWLKADSRNADAFQNYVVNHNDNVALLVSSWQYERQGASGVKIPTSTELKLIPASNTPVFSLREAYIPWGVVGGQYADTKMAVQREIEVLDSMVAGKNMYDMHFYTCDQSYPCVNFRLLEKYGMSESKCPKGTVFYSKPEAFLVKYLWQILAILLILFSVITYLVKKNSTQRKKIASLNRNNEFINVMPIPYSTANVKFDTEDNVVTIDYKVKNAAFTKILDDNVVEGSQFKLFPASFIAPKVTQLLKTHKMQVFTYHFPKTDTYYQFILCLVNTQLDLRVKDIKQIDIFAIDLTNRHRMESQLMRTKRKLDITLNVSNLIPWQYNVKTNQIIYDQYSRTKKFKESMDIQNTEVCYSYDEFLKTVHPDDLPKMIELRENLRSGRTKELNMRYRRLNPENMNTYEWCELLGTVTELDPDGKPSVAMGSIEFITQRIQQKQEMAAALERANESDRMKSAFLANMSHEIRTPLNAIVGFSNVIAYTQDEKERLEFCEIINKNNEQLLTLINDVLDLAKIESNTLDINYEECDLNQLMDHIETSMSMKVPKNVVFKAIKGCNECLAQLDQTRLTQILTNLIANSIKFTSSGTISFGYDLMDNDKLYFYVRDTGIGISKENQEKIFQRFVKLDTFVPGTGLGLSICKSIVDKMGGEIGVESAGEGKGSMFWFCIPYISAQKAPEDTDEVGFYKRRVPGRFITGNNKKIKVLIAEDNESNYRLLAHLLDLFDLVRAENGAEAVEKFISEQPDVVLMDITMPEMDGYEAFDRIRKISSKVPIIAVTANVYASDKTNILNHGFNGYVSKPITQKSIIDAIGHALTLGPGQSAVL